VIFADTFAIRAPGVVAVQEVRLLAPSHGSLGLDENHRTSSPDLVPALLVTSPDRMDARWSEP
jgi:hypothetical protein